MSTSPVSKTITDLTRKDTHLPSTQSPSLPKPSTRIHLSWPLHLHESLPHTLKYLIPKPFPPTTIAKNGVKIHSPVRAVARVIGIAEVAIAPVDGAVEAWGAGAAVGRDWLEGIHSTVAVVVDRGLVISAIVGNKELAPCVR